MTILDYSHFDFMTSRSQNTHTAMIGYTSVQSVWSTAAEISLPDAEGSLVPFLTLNIPELMTAFFLFTHTFGTRRTDFKVVKFTRLTWSPLPV